FKSEILHLFFSAKYSDNSLLFSILLGGFCLNMLFRNLYGNLLSAVGKMKINTLISALTLLLIFGFSFLFVPKFGIDGMGISLSLTLLLNGLLLMISFLYYLKNLK
ncbi:MAG TPA: polysaccharide biosynthesis protein, partial [Kaistella sp.]|nr:polysaccharide biosynthesis protein [Kaistella sp.]